MSMMRAEKLLLELQTKMPQLRENWRPEIAQAMYAISGGQGVVTESGQEFLSEAETRLLAKRRLCTRFPAHLPLRNLCTSEPNAIVIHVPVDGSYAIGLDQSLMVWVNALSRAVLWYKDDEQTMASQVAFITQTMMLHQPPRDTGPWSTVKTFFGLYWANWRTKDLTPTIVPLILSMYEFILAHELGHIELDHFSGGGAPLKLCGLSSPDPVSCSVFGATNEHDADMWSLLTCHQLAQSRLLDKHDKILSRRWGIDTEKAVRDAWRRILDLAASLFFHLTDLLDDLSPRRHRLVEPTHPTGAARREHLDLSRVNLPACGEWEQLGLVCDLIERLKSLRRSRAWQSTSAEWRALHR